MTTAFTTASFATDVLASDRPVLVDFWAPWCGPCRMLGPVVDQLARELGATHVVGKVDVDEEPELAERYGISSIPALLVFRGGQPVARAVGFQPAAQLRRFVAEAASAGADGSAGAA